MRNRNTKKDSGIERSSLAESTYSEFLLNAERYYFASQYCESQTKVLDIACGTGYGIPFFKKAEHYVAADISLDALNISRELHNQSHTSFLQCDAKSLPFKERSFDLVISFETIEHLNNPRRFLQEVKRVLKLEGKLIISTPNREYKAMWVRDINPYHVREYTIDEFHALVSKFFDSIKIYAQIPSTSQRIIDNLTWSILKIITIFPHPIASILLQIARKGKHIIFKPAPSDEMSSEVLSSHHDYEIKSYNPTECHQLKKPQTIIILATG